jgi:membrane protein required for colicin V production
LLGAALGAVKWVLFISVFICVLDYIDADGKIVSQELREESKLYKPIGAFAGMFMPAVQDMAKDILQQKKDDNGVETREI